eukprot:15433052-Alexandrium_andersonii.AAC.1
MVGRLARQCWKDNTTDFAAVPSPQRVREKAALLCGGQVFSASSLANPPGCRESFRGSVTGRAPKSPPLGASTISGAKA